MEQRLTVIEAVLFDLDGTLLDRQSSLIVYVHRQKERCADLLGPIPMADYLAKVIELDAHGHGDKDRMFGKIESSFGLPDGSAAVLLNDFMAYFPDTCVPFPGMHQTLQGLRKRGLPLGLVTNGSAASQNAKIDGLGIRGYFSAVLVSETEGVRKPDPEIFHRALRRLAVAPRDAVFVGDNPEADVHAAKAVGMQAIWMRDSYWPEPASADAVITKLCELPDVVDGLSKGRHA
jgi:putative hydrolase of the HAD superfamily